MKLIEKILSILFVIALGMNLFLIPGGFVLFMLSSMCLSSLYFFLGFALFNGIPLKKIFVSESYKDTNSLRIFGAIATGIGLSIINIAILFKVNSLPGAQMNLLFGLFIMGVITIISIIKLILTKSEYYTTILKRALIYAAISGILIGLPGTFFFEFKYREHPAYIEAFKAMKKDPNNTQLRTKFEEERTKMEND